MATRHLYIIAGCNGAGKTTASKLMLPSLLHCKQWVNADEIAHGLSPFDPGSVAIEAGRIMLSRIDYLLSQGETFAIETTLATRSYHKLVKQAQAAGYTVELLFFYLPSPEAAKKRVAHRVRNGGHDIPSDVIERRYHLGIKNLKEIFMPIVDKWSVIYNYEENFLIASGSRGEVYNIKDDLLFKEIMAGEPEVEYNASDLIATIRKAVLEMIKEMALHDDVVVSADPDGNPIWVKAREILEKNPDLTRTDVVYTPVEIDED